MLGTRSRGRSRHRANAGAAGRRDDPLPRVARRHQPCRTRQVLFACGDRDESAERVQRLSTAGYRTLSLLRRRPRRAFSSGNTQSFPELVARQEPGGHLRIISCARQGAAKHESDLPWLSSRKRMAENPFAQFSLEKAIGLRWALRDIQARRLKMSPVSDEDLTTLTGLGLVEV